MTIYTLLIVAALVAQLAGANQVARADPHLQKLNTYVKHHSNVMSREIERRLNDGVKRKVSAHHISHLFANEPSVEPTAAPSTTPAPSTSPSRKPTIRPTETPTFMPSTLSPSFFPSQNPAYVEPTDEPTASPTPLLTDNPSPMPSILPTLQPTEDPDRSSTGYFYLTESFKSDCSDPVVTFGVPINTCFVQSNYGYKIRIVDEDWANAYIDYYGDKQCTQLLEGGVAMDTGMDTCQETQGSVIINPAVKNAKVYTKMHISTSATPPRVAAIGAGVFEFFENTTTCDSTRQSLFLMYTSNVCLASTVADEHDKIEAFSVDCSDGMVQMNFDVDNVPNCAGLIGRSVYPNTCLEDQDPHDDDDIIDDDDTYAPEWLNPPPSISTTPFPTTRDVPIPELSRRVTCQASLVPTVTPTASPSRTAFPTSGVKRWVSFRAAQVITGLDLFTYEQDEEAHSYTLKQTLAQVMPGLAMDEITELTLIDVPASAKMAPAAKGLFSPTARTPVPRAVSVRSADATAAKKELDAAPHHGATQAHLRALQTSPAVTSAVRASFRILSFSSYTARQMLGQLEQALASGEFTTLLQTNAYDNSASGFQFASSSSLASSSADVGGSETVLTVGDIIGISIAGLVVMLLATYVIFVFCGAPKE